MDKAEYLILDYAVREPVILRDIVFECRLSQVEVARAAYNLFENGDILAEFDTTKGKTVKDVILTMSLIQAHLDGNFHFFCYLTPQGGAKWEAVTHVNWNRYHKWRYCGNKNSQTPELQTAEIICADRKLLETHLRIAQYCRGEILIPKTKVVEELEPWQVNYWKTLPKAYKVRYQYRKSEEPVDSNAAEESISADEKANNWSREEIDTWYTEPKFEVMEPKFPRYYPTPKKINSEKIEYLILRNVLLQASSLRVNEYSAGTEYQELSHGEIAIGADSLFQKGYIRAKVFAEGPDYRGIYDHEGTSDVVLTMTGIQDHLDGKLKVVYYLTPQGGERWEAIARPDWNKFLINNLDCMYPYEEILARKRENIEQLLAYGEYLLEYNRPIPGTEVWEVLEPWEVTYWKTLPRGYRLNYQPEKFDEELHNQSDEEFEYYIPTETEIQAKKWYKNIKKWYRYPSFGEIPPFF